jgi:O-antigen ligase
VGFGNVFHIRVTMPDISFFDWWQYITHNSILWIWMKTGVFGFVAMAAMIATALMTGVRALVLLDRQGERLPGYLQPLTLVGTLYLVMHFIFAYVDISWDAQSMLLVGAMLGVINRVAGLAQPAEEGGAVLPEQTGPLAAGGSRGR